MKSLFLIIITLSLFLPTIAQIYVDQGDVYIKNNSLVSIQGNIINKANITNEGEIQLTEDWNNQGNYTPSTGIVTLNGGQSQTLSHQGQTIATLKITQGSSVRLTSNLAIENTLILDKGIITPALNTLLVLLEQAKITGGSPEAFVNGAMYHTGLGEKFYPIGKEGQYTPLMLAQIKGENPVVGIEFFPRANLTNRSENIEFLSNSFWKQTVLSGKYNGSVVTLNIPTQSINFIEDEERLIITAGNESKGTFHNLGKSSYQRHEKYVSITSYLASNHTYLALGNLLIDTKKLYIPNAFSLHASNPEDAAIKVYGNEVAAEEFYFVILDTWGNKVFETTSLTLASTQGWNGLNIKTDNAAHAAIFRYYISGKFSDGETFKRNGTILLY